jgi:hypothetical protein
MKKRENLGDLNMQQMDHVIMDCRATRSEAVN